MRMSALRCASTVQSVFRRRNQIPGMWEEIQGIVGDAPVSDAGIVKKRGGCNESLENGNASWFSGD